MKRRLLNLLTALSLLLCVAVAALWVLSETSEPTATMGPSNAVIQFQLARPLGVLRFGGVPLGDVLGFFQDMSGCPVEVDWPALEAVGVTPHSPVTTAMSNVRLGDGLTAVLGAHEGVVYITQGNTLIVTTAVAIDRGPHTNTSRTGHAVGAAAPLPLWKVWECVLGPSRWTLAANPGVLQVWRNPADPASVYQRPTPPGAAAGTPPATLGFGGLAMERRGFPLHSLRINVPMWMLVTGTAILPLVHSVRFVRRTRRKQLCLCPACGYDLRASPERCPECGRVAPAPQESVAAPPAAR